MKLLQFTMALFAAIGSLAAAPTFPAPRTGKISVAIAVTEQANLIDFVGPRTVFGNVRVKGRGDSKGEDVPGDDQFPFDVYFVSDSTRPVQVEGDMTVIPRYSFADAPTPRIVVIGAQAGSPAMKAWLQKAAANPQTDVIMSVCTGAFRLASAGLLDGKPATTHHGFYDEFMKYFPKVELRRGARFVQSDAHTFTAGGLTSGFDLALHVVALYFGEPVAKQTADWLEYKSTEWRTTGK